MFDNTKLIELHQDARKAPYGKKLKAEALVKEEFKRNLMAQLEALNLVDVNIATTFRVQTYPVHHVGAFYVTISSPAVVTGPNGEQLTMRNANSITIAIWCIGSNKGYRVITQRASTRTDFVGPIAQQIAQWLLDYTKSINEALTGAGGNL